MGRHTEYAVPSEFCDTIMASMRRSDAIAAQAFKGPDPVIPEGRPAEDEIPVSGDSVPPEGFVVR